MDASDDTLGRTHPRANGQVKDALGQWQRFIQGQPLDSPLRPVIQESWLRCRDAGLDPEPDQFRPRRVTEEDLQRRLQTHTEVLAVARPHLDWAASAASLGPHVVYLTDREGVVLYSAGEQAQMHECGLAPGHDWSERTLGTNGVGTALASNQPVAVIGPEHYCRLLHDRTCVAAPLHAADGSSIGAIAISSGGVDVSPERLVLIAQIAFTVDRELANRAETHRGEREWAATVAALQENEERLQLMADALPVLISYIDADRRYRFNNAAYEHWFGIPRHAVRGRHMREVIGEEACQALEGHVEAALAGQPQSFEERRVPYQGAGLRDIHVDYIPHRGADGRVAGFYALIADVTERRRAEDAIKESEERLRLAVEATGMGIWSAEMPNPSRYEWSPRLKEIWGVPRAATVTPALVWSLIHPDDQDQVRQAMDAALDPCGNGRFTVEHRICRPQGTIAWIQAWGQTLFTGPPDARHPIHSTGVILDITERKNIDEELRESEELTRSILNALTAHIAVLDGEGNIIAVNRAWESFARANGDFSLARSGVGINYLEVCRGAVRDGVELSAQILSGLEQVLSGSARGFSIEYPCHSPSEERWFLLHATPLSPDLGGAVVSHTSVTPLKRVEEALRESERRWHDLAEALPQLVWTCRPDGRCDYLSRQWVAYTGKSEAEQLGYGWLEQVHPEDRDRLTGAWAAAVATTTLFDIEFRLRRADGVHRWFKTRAMPVRGTDGGVTKWFGSNTDIEDIKHATRSLHESEERFRAFMDNTSAVAWMKDGQGRYVYLNKPFEQHFCVRLADWRSKTDFEVWPQEIAEQFCRNDQAVHQSGQPREVVEHTLSAEGQHRTWLTSKFPFRDGTGRTFVGGIAFDITERKELEREVLEIAALEQRRIGQELHDSVGQELTGLGLLADALAQRLTVDSPAAAALAEKLVRGIGRVRRQVRSLSHGLVPVEVDPEGLRAALEQLAASAGESCSCVCTFAGDGPLTVTDTELATHLFRIAQEAVSNALRHSQARHIRITLQAESDAVTLSVEDDGVGFSEPLHEIKGLGLRLMRYRAGVIGGTLNVAPAAGGGTIVKCRVPRSPTHDDHPSRWQEPSDQGPHCR